MINTREITGRMGLITEALGLDQLPYELESDAQYETKSINGRSIITSASNVDITFFDSRRSQYVMAAKIDDRSFLHYDIYTVIDGIPHPDMKGLGSTFFKSAHAYIGLFNRIIGIVGAWNEDINYDQYQQAIGDRKDVSTAALSTWTGYNAQRLGYHKVKSLSSNTSLSASQYTFLFY